MLESLPGVPYTSNDRDLLRVQANMELRRKVAKEQLKVCILLNYLEHFF